MTATTRTPTRTGDDETFETALDAARSTLTYDDGPENSVEILAPESTIDDGLDGVLAWAMSHSTYAFRQALREPDEDEVDGAAPKPDRTDRTFIPLPGGDEDETHEFRVVAEYTNRYDDDRVVVETPAPWDVPDDMRGSNDVIKSLEWDDHHYDFDTDGRRVPPEAEEEWTLDVSGLEPLRELVEDTEYEFVDARDEDDDEPDAEQFLVDAAAFVEDGDGIEVRYEKKNGNGLNEYRGVVTASAIAYNAAGVGEPTGVRHRTDETTIVFEDEGGKTKRVKGDDDGLASMFSTGHYPFMGRVVGITIRPNDEDYDPLDVPDVDWSDE